MPPNRPAPMLAACAVLAPSARTATAIKNNFFMSGSFLGMRS
jgi:hypothetical protein